jgi:D-alanyl-D-alanine carboxypeptidase (penicillin-binding protein 5/6)
MKLGHYDINLGHFKTRTFAEGTFTVLSLFSLMLVGVYFKHVEESATNITAAVAMVKPITISPIHLEAHAAIVYDATNEKVLYAKNADDAWPLASLTKLMSAEAILSVKTPDSSVAITAEDLEAEGDSGLTPGDVWSLHNLLTFGLIVSSNDAMAAAAALAGTSSIINRMNETAVELGLTNTHFNNPTGLDVDVDADEAGAYGSAHDMALLAADFLKKYPEFFEATVVPKTSITIGDKTIEAIPTAEPLLDIPGLIGAKTGYTELAGGNLIAVFDLEVGHPVVVVVLGSSIDGRFSDVRNLITATREASQTN